MKTIIAALVFVTSTAWAQIQIQPVLPRLVKTTIPMNKISLPVKISLSKTVFKVDQVDDNIQSIELDNNGLVRVIDRQSGNTFMFILSDLNKADILPYIDYLGEAELETLHFSAVCEMMPNPNTVQVISVFDKTLNRLEMIMSPRGCMYESIIQPKYEGQRELALDINTKLITLARQYYK